MWRGERNDQQEWIIVVTVDAMAFDELCRSIRDQIGCLALLDHRPVAPPPVGLRGIRVREVINAPAATAHEPFEPVGQWTDVGRTVAEMPLACQHGVVSKVLQ